MDCLTIVCALYRITTERYTLCTVQDSYISHCLRYIIVYYYNGAQRYEQFLQVGRLYRPLILLGLALFQAPLCLRSSWCYVLIFLLTSFSYLLVSWAWWDWPLTWLTNRRPSVLWYCWLGHVTHKIVSEMTYNVSSGTLNPTIPSSLHGLLHQSPHKHALVHLSLLFWHKQCPVLQWFHLLCNYSTARVISSCQAS